MVLFNSMSEADAITAWRRRYNDLWRDNKKRIAWETDPNGAVTAEWIEVYWYAGENAVQF